MEEIAALEALTMDGFFSRLTANIWLKAKSKRCVITSGTEMEANGEFEYANGYRIQQCFSSTILFMHNHILPLLTGARMHSILTLTLHLHKIMRIQIHTFHEMCLVLFTLGFEKVQRICMPLVWILFFSFYRYMYVCFSSAFFWRFHYNKIRSWFDRNSEVMVNQSSNGNNNNEKLFGYRHLVSNGKK